MKKTILFVLLLTISAASFSQPINPSPTLTKQDYLKKSNNQKFVAWTVLTGGTIALALAAIDTDVCVGAGCTKNSFPAVAAGIGAVCIAGSIPFFIASGKNKRKAMSISFKNEMTPQLHNVSVINRSVPSLSLRISL